MMRLNADGTISLDFDIDGRAEPLVVVLRRPSFGAFKRLRRAQADADAAQKAIIEEIRTARDVKRAAFEDDTVGLDSEETAPFQERLDDVPVDWWKLAILGDDTFNGLAAAKADIPTAVDDWPMYLVQGAVFNEDDATTIGTIGLAMQHWRTVPLDRGGKQPPTN